MAFVLVENFRGFFISRPPLVIFMICLGSFAIALITLAYIVKIKDVLPNPDVTEDWNLFFDKFTELDFCVVSDPGESLINGTQLMETPFDRQMRDGPVKVGLESIVKHSPWQMQQASTTSSSDTSTVVADQSFNVTIQINVDVYYPSSYKQVANGSNFTFLSIILQGHHLGLTGSKKELEANVSLVLPSSGNFTYCNRRPCFKLVSCLTIVAPARFFPSTKRPEPDERCLGILDSVQESHWHLQVQRSLNQCRNFSRLALNYEYDPALTVMLSMQDRSVINLHLMHTSYFLFVMIVTLFCYAIIKGRPSKIKVIHTQHMEKYSQLTAQP